MCPSSLGCQYLLQGGLKVHMSSSFGRELGIEAGVTAATYTPGALHPHLAHYHAPPRLHHLQLGALPLMVT